MSHERTLGKRIVGLDSSGNMKPFKVYEQLHINIWECLKYIGLGALLVTFAMMLFTYKVQANTIKSQAGELNALMQYNKEVLTKVRAKEFLARLSALNIAQKVNELECTMQANGEWKCLK